MEKIQELLNDIDGRFVGPKEPYKVAEIAFIEWLIIREHLFELIEVAQFMKDKGITTP